MTSPAEREVLERSLAELGQISAEMNVLSNRLLAMMDALRGERDAQLALDSARHGLSRSLHDLQRAKTRLKDSENKQGQIIGWRIHMVRQEAL